MTKKNKFLKKRKAKEEPAPEPTTKICPFCLSEINIKATRCPHCTSELELKKEDKSDAKTKKEVEEA